MSLLRKGVRAKEERPKELEPRLPSVLVSLVVRASCVGLRVGFEIWHLGPRVCFGVFRGWAGLQGLGARDAFISKLPKADECREYMRATPTGNQLVKKIGHGKRRVPACPSEVP